MGWVLGIGNGVVFRHGSGSWTQQIYILKSGATWYKRETNTTGGTFTLYYSSDSGGTWDALFTLDLTEDNVIIDSSHIYRHRIVGTEYHVDQTLTPTGYAGLENTDWENLYST